MALEKEHVPYTTISMERKTVEELFTGYCKYVASQIEERLRNESIHTYWIDLNDIISIEHVVLIAEFRYFSGIPTILDSG